MHGGYWLMFVIVAVGLVLSWGQIGRKAERVMAETPVRILHAEDDCRPARAPCAALGPERALVLGPGSRGLILRATGMVLPVRDIEVMARSVSGDENALVPLAMNDAWLLDRLPPDLVTLRVSLYLDDGVTVAEFPLAPPQMK